MGIETYLALTKKLKLDDSIAKQCVEQMISLCKMGNITAKNFEKAFWLKSKHGFSFLDSVIVASALHTGCTTLYTEDMQHGLVVEQQMTIVNPFL